MNTYRHCCMHEGFEVTLLPVILGFTEAVYLTNVSALPALGIEKAQAKKLLYDLHAHAVQMHHTTIKLRRKLEKKSNPRNAREIACNHLNPHRPATCLLPNMVLGSRKGTSRSV